MQQLLRTRLLSTKESGEHVYSVIYTPRLQKGIESDTFARAVGRDPVNKNTTGYFLNMSNISSQLFPGAQARHFAINAVACTTHDASGFQVRTKPSVSRGVIFDVKP